MSSEHLLCDRRPPHTTSSKPHAGFHLHTESSEAGEVAEMGCKLSTLASKHLRSTAKLTAQTLFPQ